MVVLAYCFGQQKMVEDIFSFIHIGLFNYNCHVTYDTD